MTKPKAPKIDFDIFRQENLITSMDILEQRGLIKSVDDTFILTEQGKMAKENSK